MQRENLKESAVVVQLTYLFLAHSSSDIALCFRQRITRCDNDEL